VGVLGAVCRCAYKQGYGGRGIGMGVGGGNQQSRGHSAGVYACSCQIGAHAAPFRETSRSSSVSPSMVVLASYRRACLIRSLLGERSQHVVVVYSVEHVRPPHFRDSAEDLVSHTPALNCMLKHVHVLYCRW
jgi:hypothetical protein